MKNKNEDLKSELSETIKNNLKKRNYIISFCIILFLVFGIAGFEFYQKYQEDRRKIKGAMFQKKQEEIAASQKKILDDAKKNENEEEKRNQEALEKLKTELNKVKTNKTVNIPTPSYKTPSSNNLYDSGGNTDNGLSDYWKKQEEEKKKKEEAKKQVLFMMTQIGVAYENGYTGFSPYSASSFDSSMTFSYIGNSLSSSSSSEYGYTSFSFIGGRLSSVNNFQIGSYYCNYIGERISSCSNYSLGSISFNFIGEKIYSASNYTNGVSGNYSFIGDELYRVSDYSAGSYTIN